MTVYVLTHQDVSDDGTFTDVIKVYDNKEKAEAAFKVRVEQYEEYYDKEGYEIAEDEGYIRKELAATVNLRNTPQITFVIDQSIEYGVNMIAKIDEIMQGQSSEGTLLENEDI